MESEGEELPEVVMETLLVLRKRVVETLCDGVADRAWLGDAEGVCVASAVGVNVAVLESVGETVGSLVMESEKDALSEFEGDVDGVTDRESVEDGCIVGEIEALTAMEVERDRRGVWLGGGVIERVIESDVEALGIFDAVAVRLRDSSLESVIDVDVEVVSVGEALTSLESVRDRVLVMSFVALSLGEGEGVTLSVVDMVSSSVTESLQVGVAVTDWDVVSLGDDVSSEEGVLDEVGLTVVDHDRVATGESDGLGVGGGVLVGVVEVDSDTVISSDGVGVIVSDMDREFTDLVRLGVGDSDTDVVGVLESVKDSVTRLLV